MAILREVCSTEPIAPPVLLLSLLAATLFAAPGSIADLAPAAVAAPRAPLISTQAIASARRFARTRGGTVAFAVAEPGHTERGLRRTMQFPSASIVKAMLLVARLRAVGQHPLSAVDRACWRR